MIPGHVLEKNTRNLIYEFFPPSFNRKYVHTVACRSSLYDPRILCSTLIGAAMLLVLFPAVATKTMVQAVALTVFLSFLVKDPFV